ncbi:helix-turn-helix domain-containing protein [Leucobacter sp. CSA1]|uniref:Helix-turn-helix domain-containing protein n=1 Tax=Leucobacter chromiisoli TaxID=2796471 RepID=A0A934Q3W0_9MICO|nr:helix-turn-helix domain-containing protein [Leucobacter chromiisoli]MBK0417899.1 helix-turn-helix domain-containing protein [Leucobacter chromiisoli]
MAAKSTPASGPEVDASNGPQAVHRALEVLTLVVDSGPLTLSDIARASGLPTSTTMRMLRALETWGYVFRSADGRYDTGSRFVQSRVSADGARPEDLIDLSAAVMQRLTQVTLESSYLAVAGPANTCTFLREVQSPLPIRHVRFDGWEGRTVPMAGSVVEEVLEGRIPETGFVVNAAVADPDSVVLGAPVYSVDGACVAVLEVTGPRFRMPDDVVAAHGEALKAAASELSELLVRGA